MDEYKYPLGKEELLSLALSTQAKYLRYLLHDAHKKYGHVDSRKAFFMCLHPGFRSWLTQMEARVEREITTKCALAGTTVATSATPVHREHIRSIVIAYLRSHFLRLGGDGVYKRLVILLSWYAVGRSAEVGILCFDLCEWDAHFSCLSIWWHQPKVSKSKKVALVASGDPHMCPFNAFADLFAMGAYRDSVFDGDRPAWVFPNLATSSDAGGTIGSWITALNKNSAAKDLQCVPFERTTCYSYHESSCIFTPPPPSSLSPCDRRVKIELPAGQNASGIRVGACTLLHGEVDDNRGADVSGHQEEGKVGRFPVYPVVDIQMMMPGVSALAGWQPPTRFHPRGPAPASLKPLITIGIDSTKLDALASTFFHIVKGASYDGFTTEGKLYPFLLVMLATKIMNYNFNTAVNKLSDGGEVCDAPHGLVGWLEKCVTDVGLAGDDARATLSAWSDLLTKQFDVDNAHMSPVGRAIPDLAPLVAAISSLSSVVSEQSRAIASNVAALTSRLTAVEKAVAAMARAQERSIRAPINLSAGFSVASPVSRSGDAVAIDAGATPTGVNGQPAHAGGTAASAIGAYASGSEGASASAGGSTDATVGVSAGAGHGAGGGGSGSSIASPSSMFLHAARPGDRPNDQVRLSEVTIVRLIRVHSSGSTLNFLTGANKSVAAFVYDAATCLASPAHRAILIVRDKKDGSGAVITTRDEGAVLRTSLELVAMLIARLQLKMLAAGGGSKVIDPSMLKPEAFENQLKNLAKLKKVTLDVVKTSFKTRPDVEEQKAIAERMTTNILRVTRSGKARRPAKGGAKFDSERSSKKLKLSVTHGGSGGGLGSGLGSGGGSGGGGGGGGAAADTGDADDDEHDEDDGNDDMGDADDGGGDTGNESREVSGSGNVSGGGGAPSAASRVFLSAAAVVGSFFSSSQGTPK